MDSSRERNEEGSNCYGSCAVAGSSLRGRVGKNVRVGDRKADDAMDAAAAGQRRPNGTGTGISAPRLGPKQRGECLGCIKTVHHSFTPRHLLQLLRVATMRL